MRRMKRGVLDAISRWGYDVEKNPGSFPPYRFFRRLKLGDDPLSDIKVILTDGVRCVFDVGAHVGQTAARLAHAFPRAHIYSFEPDPRSYAALQAYAKEIARVTAINGAVGDADGQATFFVNRFDQTNSLLKAAPGANEYLLVPGGLDPLFELTVPLLTLDRFCRDRTIERIDVLKLDVQGYELHVLDGARGLLERLAVPLIFLEVCFVPIYEGQPLFPEIYQYLYERGYRLVWLYDSSFHTHLYSVAANALFIHSNVGTRER